MLQSIISGYLTSLNKEEKWEESVTDIKIGEIEGQSINVLI